MQTSRYLSPAVCGIVALLLYVTTAAPGITWANDGADGGDLIAAVATRGVPHPSGYPIYCLLARAFATLPLGDMARRLNLFSSVAAAAAAALFTFALANLLPRGASLPQWRRAAMTLLGGLAFCTSATLWSQATITQVYALHAFFAALALYMASRQDALINRNRSWLGLGLCFGLGLGNHLTLALLVPGLVVLLWRIATLRKAFLAALGTLLGLSIYLYLPFAAAREPMVNWGACHTWDGFWWVVSGAPYHAFVVGLPLEYLPSRLGAWVNLWREQYSWLGIALALVGLLSWLSEQRARALASLLLYTLPLVYAVTYDTTDSYVYLIPAHMIAALWLVIGANHLLEMAAGAYHTKVVQIIAIATLALVPGWSVVTNWPALDIHSENAATEWLDVVLTELPADATLITGQDNHTFALDYAQWVEKQRTDVLVIDGELIQYDWYLRSLERRHPDQQVTQHASTIDSLISAQLARGPVYLASERPGLEQSYRLSRGDVLIQLTGYR